LSKYSVEERISEYIDSLINEKKPETSEAFEDRDFGKLMDTVRLVRTLREPELPDEGYPERLAQAVSEKIKQRKLSGFKRVFSPIRIAAACLMIIALVSSLGLLNRDVVYAMERAVSKLANYHGIMEMRMKNAMGEEWLVRRVELWSEGDKYHIKQDDGTLIINNGEKKWQVSQKEKQVAILPILPDTTLRSIDLRDEAKRAKQYPHTVVGKELIAGRQATKLAISPPGGAEYYLWVDAETNLPVQLQTAMQNALQTTYTFVSFEPNVEIEPGIFFYQVPEGYQVVENNPGQLAATIEEAVLIAGFVPLLPETAPNRILAFSDKIILDYSDTIIMETPARGEFELAAGAALGSTAEGPLEIYNDRLRWREKGIEIQVEGEQRNELASQIAAELNFPETDQDLSSRAEVSVPVDMEIVEANQKQVDRGSSPWQLDPLQVSLTFANLIVTPEGIQGEPQIPMTAFSLAENNFEEAIVDVAEGPIERLYLKRLIRADETGIWTVVGYDPR